MSKELIIHSGSAEINIVLLDNKRIIELHKEHTDTNFSVGDIYLGKVKKLNTGLNAAFVDVGHERDAFLHYLDLGPQVKSFLKYTRGTLSGQIKSPWLGDFQHEKEIEKTGQITSVLSQQQPVLVQITKEPISSKGPRIFSEVTLAGRYLVLVPFSDKVSVSQKINSREERERLKRLMLSIKPNHFGVIVRTVAENKKVAELDSDLKNLLSKWEECYNNIKIAIPPAKVLGELNRTSTILRDLLNESFTSIVVDEQKMYSDIKTYLQTIAPEKEKILKLHKGDQQLFDKYGITKQVKALFGKYVNIPGGGYLIIEHTEAMHVIDINSGNTGKSNINQEETALNVNCEAAAEVARQLRLRDMGGIIVVDFIDMRSAENRKTVFQKLIEEMKTDRAKHTVLPLSRFGVMEITRQRVRPEMEINTQEVCPSCKGTGQIQSSILLVDEIENNLRFLIQDKKVSTVTITVHPFVEAFLKQGYPSIQQKWLVKYRKWIKVKSSLSNHLMEYGFGYPGFNPHDNAKNAELSKVQEETVEEEV